MRVPLKVTNDTFGQGDEDWLTEEDAGYPLSCRVPMVLEVPQHLGHRV